MVQALALEAVLENPIVKGMPLFDVQRVEVLRGPQGTLFGRNTPAGIVKFETRKPSRQFDGYARVSYGTYDNIDFKAAVGGGLSETLSARVAGVFQTQSDWIDNAFTGEENALGGQQTFAGRLQLLWEPAQEFKALLNVHGWDLDGTARIFRANILQKGTNELVDGYSQGEIAQDGLNDHHGLRRFAQARLRLLERIRRTRVPAAGPRGLPCAGSPTWHRRRGS